MSAKMEKVKKVGQNMRGFGYADPAGRFIAEQVADLVDALTEEEKPSTNATTPAATAAATTVAATSGTTTGEGDEAKGGKGKGKST